jgi:hypothetical protein
VAMSIVTKNMGWMYQRNIPKWAALIDYHMIDVLYVNIHYLIIFSRLDSPKWCWLSCRNSDKMTQWCDRICLSSSSLT